jgi:hypothetical protein
MSMLRNRFPNVVSVSLDKFKNWSRFIDKSLYIQILNLEIWESAREIHMGASVTSGSLKELNVDQKSNQKIIYSLINSSSG